MVLGVVGKYAAIAILIIFAFFYFKRANEVGLGPAITELGTAGSSIGSGVQGALTGVGTGISQLFNPAYTLLDLAGRAQSLFNGGSQGGGGNMAAAATGQRPREVTQAASSAAAARATRTRSASPAATTTPTDSRYFTADGQLTSLARAIRSSYNQNISNILSRANSSDGAASRRVLEYYRSLPRGVLGANTVVPTATVG